MKRSPFNYEEIAKELTKPRHKFYRRPPIKVPKTSNKSARSNKSQPDYDEMDIMRLASRNVKFHPMTKRTGGHVADDDKDDSSSTDSTGSKRVKVIHKATHSLISSGGSESSLDYRNTELYDDDVLEVHQVPKKKDVSCEPKGNHYALSKIVDYLHHRTLASYFKNPPKADRMKISGLANVTKSLLAASVVHLGGKYDRHADSYFRGLRQGLIHASDRHEMQQEREIADEGKQIYENREQRSTPSTGVPRDLREVHLQGRQQRVRKPVRPRVFQETNRRRVFRPRQHTGRVCCDDDGKESGVRLCSLEELKQLEALSLSRKRVWARRRRSDTSASRSEGSEDDRRRGEREGGSSSRSRSRKRDSYEPDVARMGTSRRTRHRKREAKRPKKYGGRWKRH